MFKSMSHVAVVCRDLERSRAFYEEKLGLKPVAEFVLEDRGVDEVLGLEKARLHIVMLRAGDDESHPVVELTHYERPAGQPVQGEAAFNAFGCRHLAFGVEDVDAEYARLSKAGVEFTSPPKVVQAGDLGQVKIAFFHDPDGVAIEIVQPA